MFKSEKTYPYIAFSISFLILLYFYHTVFFNLNDYIFASSGDGIKNYYTYLYHAKYDTSFFDFSGMNYPFYENVVYTDAHPLLSYLIGKLGLVDYGIGILNFLMLISYPISTIFIFKILKNYKVELLWSVLASVALTFMAPQVFRLTGHLSLSYVFAIPILWYLLIKVSQTNALKWNIISSLYLLIFFFTHPYLGLILSVFALTFALVSWVANRKEKGRLKQFFINILFQVAIPIIVFQVMVILTDTHTGRLNNPAGFLTYFATLKSLLVAHHGPMTYLGFTNDNWESWSYLGLGTILYAITILIYSFKNRQSIHFKSLFKKPLFLFFTASILVLLFAMCIPFRWDMFKWIVNLFGPLKQFRVLGRFTWVFFYVFTVFCVILLYKIREKNENKRIFNSIFFVGICLYMIEFYPTHNSLQKRLSSTKNPFKIENVNPDLKEVIDLTNQGDYDAIIFLPFTHLSSESVYILGSEHANYQALLLSFYTHTPLFNTMSSRTSLHEAINTINLFSPEFIDKKMAKIVGNDKKILLVKNNDGLDQNEQRMTWSAEKIFKNNSFTAFNFSFDKWNDRQYFDAIIEQSEQATVELKQGWKSDTTTWFYYESFDDLPEKNAMSGNGAFAEEKIGWNKLIELDSNILPEGEFILNFWFNINIGRPDILAVAEKITADTTEWVDQFMVRETNLIIDETWAYVELNFSFKSTDKINILLTSGPSGDWMVVDELLIRQQNGGNLFKDGILHHDKIVEDSRNFLIYNNYWINKNAFKTE